MRVRILPYRAGSTSARLLSRALDVPRLRVYPTRSRFRPRPRDLIINWGSHTYPTAEWNVAGRSPRWLNKPQPVYFARNKLLCFRKLSEAGVPTVEWTEQWDVAHGWLRPHPHEPSVGAFARTTLTGQGGAGIVPIYHATEYGAEGEVWPTASLYTKYFKAKHEARVHVVNGQTYAQKKRRRDGVEPNVVRNHANGYVYCTGNFTCPDGVQDVAKRAVAALGLDFGAVDLLYTNDDEVRVLEVNSAPGIEGSTLNWYADRLREVIL